MFTIFLSIECYPFYFVIILFANTVSTKRISQNKILHESLLGVCLQNAHPPNICHHNHVHSLIIFLYSYIVYVYNLLSKYCLFVMNSNSFLFCNDVIIRDICLYYLIHDTLYMLCIYITVEIKMILLSTTNFSILIISTKRQTSTSLLSIFSMVHQIKDQKY